jgi:hypothetical protein
MMFLLVGLNASATPKKEYGEIEIDWKQDNAEYGEVMMCDDTYLSGIILTVGGVYREDFHVDMEAPLDWRVLSVKPTLLNGLPATQIKIKGGADSVTIKLYRFDRETKTKKTAVVEITDAC